MSLAENYHPETIRRELPDELTDEQTAALVTAVRNPDASIEDVSADTGVSFSVAANALETLALGLFGEHDGVAQMYDSRGAARPAESFDELTEKQQVVIDFLARHPSFEWQLRSSRELRDAIEADDTIDLGENIHYTYPKRVAAEYQDLIPERRAEVDESDEAVDPNDADLRIRYSTPRELLEQAGLTDLPDENLDDLPDADAGESERLELAYERGTSTESADVNLDVPLTEFVGYINSTKLDDDDVTIGQGYHGIVNGVVDWGVWVTIGGDPERPDDVSGVVPIERLDDRGIDLDALAEGDRLPVIAVGRSDTDDGKVRHRLALPSWYTNADEPVERQSPIESMDLEPEQAGENAESGASDDATDETVEDTEESKDEQSGDERDALGTVEAEVAAVQDELEILAEQIEHVEARLDTKANDGPLGALAERLDSHEQEIERLRSDLSAVKTAESRDEYAPREQAFLSMFDDLVLDDRTTTKSVSLDGFGVGHTAELTITVTKEI